MDEVRCPFCIEGNGFKVMSPEGPRVVCGSCGHIVMPGSPTYICSCPKCKELNRPMIPQRDESRRSRAALIKISGAEMVYRIANILF